MLDIVAESDSESETEPTNSDMAGSSSSTTEASPRTYPAGTVAKLVGLVSVVAVYTMWKIQ
jgi:hypothetical protein